MDIASTEVSTTLCIPLGRYIPLPEYDELNKMAWSAHLSATDARAFGQGWLGMAQRALGASKHYDAFAVAIKNGTNASHLESYEQDEHFFGFVTNATAAAENLIYAALALSYGLKGATPTAKELRVNRDDALKAVIRSSVLAEFGLQLEKQVDDEIARTLFEMRDVVLHRGRPPRNQYVGGPYSGKATVASNPKAPSEEWDNDFVFDVSCLDAWADWLRRTIDIGMVVLFRCLNEAVKAPGKDS